MKIYTHLPPYSTSFINELLELSALVFGQRDPDYLVWRLNHMPDLAAFTATSAQELVGFKIGYAMTQSKYYSWLGGVQPSHRRNGVASALMVSMHEWVAQKGYSLIETAADQENIEMARLNLAHGFRPSGIRCEPKRTQIIF